MNRLSFANRTCILRLLCERNSIGAVTRMTGCSKNTVTKLLIDAGAACAVYHDEHVRNVKVTSLKCDAIWSFTCCGQKDVATADCVRDAWTWTALEGDTKLIVSYLVGGRDGEYAMALISDLRRRVASPVRLSTDGRKAYLHAREKASDDDINAEQLVRLYGRAPEAFEDSYAPTERIGPTSTGRAERQSLTMPIGMRRFSRLPDASSKKMEDFALAIALQVMYYNFVRVHPKLHTSPAMAARISGRLWETGDIVTLL